MICLAVMSVKRLIMLRFDDEKGVVSLLITAVSLPLILLLAVAAFNLSRFPAVENNVASHLTGEALGSDYICASRLQGGSCLKGVAPNEEGQCDVNIDSYLPAAHNLCVVFGEGSSDEEGCIPSKPEANTGILSSEKASKIARRIAENTYCAIKGDSASWLYSYRDVHVEIQFVKAVVRRDSGVVNAVNGYGSKAVAGYVNGNILSVDLVLRDIKSSFLNRKLGWEIEACGLGSQSFQSCPTTWLDSYWVVATASVKIDALFGGIGLPEPPSADGTYIVSSYSVVPYSNVAGIESVNFGEIGVGLS
ncbi:MAG: hypothetical protein D6808_05900 [Candidatus Dadabacteria bacterium]|nr:MAG: hypothetical protein D6808_05900 [Candidatus Dadabacteria bacterium]